MASLVHGFPFHPSIPHILVHTYTHTHVPTYPTDPSRLRTIHITPPIFLFSLAPSIPYVHTYLPTYTHTHIPTYPTDPSGLRTHITKFSSFRSSVYSSIPHIPTYLHTYTHTYIHTLRDFHTNHSTTTTSIIWNGISK